MKELKIQQTIRLAPEVLAAAKAVARRTNTPLAVVLADAVRRTLAAEDSVADQLQSAHLAVLNRVASAERKVVAEIAFLEEALGLFVRTFLNHTPAVPESERAAASLSGQVRFLKFLELLHRNLKQGITILEDRGTGESDVRHG